MSGADEMTKKKEIIDQKLQQRELERLANVDRRESDRKANQVEHEQVELFDKTINDEKEAIEKSLSGAGNMDRQQVSDLLDSLTKKCLTLQKYVSDSTIFLPSYHVRKSQETVSNLLAAVQETRENLIPTKKFAFRRKKAVAAKAADDNASKPEPDVNKNVEVRNLDVGFKDSIGQTLKMSAEEVAAKDICLQNLKDCKVSLEGSASTVHMTGLANCTLLIGPVSTSVYVDDCEDCDFVVACQQLRVHRTKNSGFYVEVSSRPIIEDSNAVGFAPYNWTYADIEQHFARSGLNRDVNHWHDVADFNWLSAERPSPNWFVIGEQKRVKSWF